MAYSSASRPFIYLDLLRYDLSAEAYISPVRLMLLLQRRPEWAIQSEENRSCRPHPCFLSAAEGWYLEVDIAHGEKVFRGASFNKVKALELRIRLKDEV